MGAPGLVRVGPRPSRPGQAPGLVGPGRSPAAVSEPGLFESGPGLVGLVRSAGARLPWARRACPSGIRA